MSDEVNNEEELIVVEKSLLDELRENRLGMYDVLKEATSMRTKLDKVMPSKSEDFRNRFALENKMKVITDVIKSELDIRKQIDSSLKQELEMSNKISAEEDTVFDHGHLREVAKQLEELKKSEH